MTPVRILLYYVYAIFHKYRSPEHVDMSATSSYYMNNITVSTGLESASYSFVGSRNEGFVRALAIIIFMARRGNHRCRIDKAAYKAAEKGSEHYAGWEKDKRK